SSSRADCACWLTRRLIMLALLPAMASSWTKVVSARLMPIRALAMTQGPDVVAVRPGLVGEDAGQGTGGTVDELLRASLQRGAACDHPGAGRDPADRGRIGPGQRSSRSHDDVAEGVQHRVPGRPGPDRLDQQILERAHPGVDQVLLGREVIEHGGRRYV